MNQKKLKPKICTKNKSYSLNQCALYKVTTKKKLAQLLGVDLVALKEIDKSNYNTFIQLSKNGKKPRNIQQPVGLLDIIHTRIASLLCRVTQPPYVHSGVQKKSHITNAKAHREPNPVLATDINKFYESTTRGMVFAFFYVKMKCSSDVANLLADLCTYDGHIPTGSRISMPLSFWACSSMFDSLYRSSNGSDVKMTLFVDDLTFSGKNANKLFLSKVKAIVNEHGHRLNSSKTTLYDRASVKIITGVAMNGESNRIFARNKQLKSLYQDMELWRGIVGLPNSEIVYQRLMGKLNSLAAIDPKYKDKARTVRLRQKCHKQ